MKIWRVAVSPSYIQDARFLKVNIHTCIYDLPEIMDKISHTILYVDETNIIVTSTNCIDLQKVNLTLQLISKWFQINHLLLNKNKTFAINF